jgi:hypothetical protein
MHRSSLIASRAVAAVPGIGIVRSAPTARDVKAVAWSYPSAPRPLLPTVAGALGSRCYRERGGVGSALRWCWLSQSTSSLASRVTTSRSVAGSRGISSGGCTPSGRAAWRTAAGRAGRARGRGPGEDRRRGAWDGGSRRFGVWGAVMRGPARPGRLQPASPSPSLGAPGPRAPVADPSVLVNPRALGPAGTPARPRGR